METEKTNVSRFNKTTILILALIAMAIGTTVVTINVKKLYRNRHMDYKEAITTWMEKNYGTKSNYEPIDYEPVDSIYVESPNTEETPVLDKIVIKHKMKFDNNVTTLYFVYDNPNGTIENVRFIYNDKIDLINQFEKINKE